MACGREEGAGVLPGHGPPPVAVRASPKGFPASGGGERMLRCLRALGGAWPRGGAVPFTRVQKRRASPSSRNRTSDLRMSTRVESTVLRSTS